MANSADPDQMPQNAASDLGLHCLQSLSVPILKVITFIFEALFPVVYRFPGNPIFLKILCRICRFHLVALTLFSVHSGCEKCSANFRILQRIYVKRLMFQVEEIIYSCFSVLLVICKEQKNDHHENTPI